MRIRRILMSVDAVGGVWTYALELAAGLAAQGIHVLFAVLGPEPNIAQRRQAAQVRGLSIACGGYPLEWEPGAMPAQGAAGAWLLQLANNWHPDLVHLNHYGHGHLPWPAPCLVVAHSCVLSWFEHVRHAAADESWADYRRGVTRGLRGATMVIAPTRAMLKDTARLYGPLPRSRVIHNGRRLETFAPSRKQPFVFSAGRLWDDAKNVHLLGRIAGQLPWPVRVAGEHRAPGGRGHEPGPGLVPLGFLGAEAMARTLGEASIYALPARYEPFGLSVLEAAGAGCALVLGDIASLRELWDGAADFVAPDDAEALQRSLARLIADPALRARRGRQALDRARRFHAVRMVRDYLGTYRQLVSRQETVPCAS
jgi:glycosyltransferase involved in cell wall biosynthesis